MTLAPTSHSADLFRQPHRHGPDYATWLVKRQAALIKRKLKLQVSDRQDIEQELLLDLLQRWPQFDPARGKPSTFIARVVRNRAVELIQSYAAQGRRTSTAGALFEQFEAEQLEDEALRETLGAQLTEDPAPAMDRRLDLEPVLKSLPAKLRKVCEALQSHSVAQAAKQLKLPRTTLLRHMAEIRAHFEACGITADDLAGGGGEGEGEEPHGPTRVAA